MTLSKFPFYASRIASKFNFAAQYKVVISLYPIFAASGGELNYLQAQNIIFTRLEATVEDYLKPAKKDSGASLDRLGITKHPGLLSWSKKLLIN